jgi:hypothetical protein
VFSATRTIVSIISFEMGFSSGEDSYLGSLLLLCFCECTCQLSPPPPIWKWFLCSCLSLEQAQEHNVEHLFLLYVPFLMFLANYLHNGTFSWKQILYFFVIKQEDFESEEQTFPPFICRKLIKKTTLVPVKQRLELQRVQLEADGRHRRDVLGRVLAGKLEPILRISIWLWITVNADKLSTVDL